MSHLPRISSYVPYACTRSMGWYNSLKSIRRDCTNNNELLHKIGVLQRYVMQLFIFTSELLQAIRWRSKYNSKIPKTKLKARDPVKLFFLFFILQRSRKFFAIYMFAEKKHALMFYAHVKRLHSVKWRGLYGDSATMQEL